MFIPRFTFPSGVLRNRVASIAALAFAMVATVASSSQAADFQVFRFHHDNILGTSLDLEICATDDQQAAAVETAVLDEIERLRKILSTYDPASDVSRLNAATGPVICPQELIDVLSFYEYWSAKSNGAYNGHLGELIATWKAAEKAGVLPDPATLQAIVQRLALPGWSIDRTAKTVTRLTPQPLNIDSLGKGYIIGKAAAAVHLKFPSLAGLLVNIGGDIYVAGHPSPGTPWTISVQNPVHSEDNAPPLTQLLLSDRAVSTSAAYERGYTIAGKRYSHIFNPHTGMTAEGTASATVISAYSANSNALATTLCVLKPGEGLELVKQIPDTDCLIIGADGKQYRTAHFSSYEVSPTQPQATATPSAAVQQPAKASLWPNGYEVTLDISLKVPAEPNLRHLKRPFMAVWVTDAGGKAVRTIAVWGDQRKYLPELHEWWKTVGNSDKEWAVTVTRATRSAGHYRLEWDGMDDHGAPLPPGTYTIFQEINREFGAYAIKQGTIVCSKDPAKGAIPASMEFDETGITYGPAPSQ